MSASSKRAATVKAIGRAECLRLGRGPFQLLVGHGPCHDHMEVRAPALLLSAWPATK